MHLDNENYIIFINALKVYKYKMLSFKLTNESIFFQQYMNDVLWNFLNDFCQVYLDDILIYSKMRKKHKDHIKLVLSQLRKAELQMNIRKCKFNVEETIFLEIIISELSLRHFNLKWQAILKINASNYVKDEILFQYDDEKVLHSVIFYSKSMILTEINYHIYDKKLLVIIWCFEHWWLELKCTELLIQMFFNHQTLKIFMKNKQLSQWQVNYLNILLKFNFQIIFRSGKINTKVNALIRMSLANIFESAQRLEDCFQTILISDRVDVLSIESKANLYQWVCMINQTDELCSKYKQVMNDNKLKFYITKLKNCEIIDDVLFRKDLL